MISYPRRPKSGHITCYLNRTYHVLPTASPLRVDRARRKVQTFLDSTAPRDTILRFASLLFHCSMDVSSPNAPSPRTFGPP